jgi:hypothetical protein
MGGAAHPVMPAKQMLIMARPYAGIRHVSGLVHCAAQAALPSPTRTLPGALSSA